MIEKIIGFFQKAMESTFRIYENGLKNIVTKFKNLSLLLAKKVRSVLRSFVNYIFAKPQSLDDYIHIGDLFISKQILLRVILIGVIAAFMLIQYTIPYFEGKLWRASLIINTNKFHDFTGKVKLYRENGTLLYIGDLRNGEAEGKGEVYENDMLVYKGDMSDSKYNGNGSLYEDGVLIYEGGFLNNNYNGEGRLYYKSGAIKFYGNFLEGNYIEGTEYYTNGKVKYKGTFENEMYFGTGTIYTNTSNNRILYTGNFVNGLYEGNGKLYSNTGYILYEGNFSSGLYEGNGKLYMDKGNILYEGNFSNGIYNGNGFLYDEDSGKLLYNGNFLNGKYSGEGKLYFAESGRLKYNGQFMEGSFSGFGQLYSERGKEIFVGEFIENNINYISFFGSSLEEIREAFGNETGLYLLKNSYIAYYDNFGIGFEFDYTENSSPVVNRIKFFDNQNIIEGIYAGMELESAKNILGDNIYNEYGYEMLGEDIFFCNLANVDVSSETRGYIVRYIFDDIYYNLYSDVSGKTIFYFEIGEV